MLALNDDTVCGLRYATEVGLYSLGRAHYVSTYKSAATTSPETSHALSGRLYLSRSNWLLLSVPNAVVRGLFDALDEPGVELPLRQGRLEAHVSVMRPEEVERIGGPDRITERGHAFRWNMGPVKVVRPAGWKDVSKVWFCAVRSPELEALRRSYGLSSLPDEDRKPFHLTFALRRSGVLRDNGVAKSSSREPANAVRKASSDGDRCPECGESYVVRCRCLLGDKRCQAGHEWHTCPEHGVVVRGCGHGRGTGFSCTCGQTPRDKKARHDLPYRDRAEVYALRRGSVLSGLLPSGEPAMFGGGVDEAETPAEAAARELFEETGYRVENLRPAGVEPLLRDWPAVVDESKLSDEQKERRRRYRGDRTHFFLGDVVGRPDVPPDPSKMEQIRFRRPATISRLLDATSTRGAFEPTHRQVLSGLSRHKESMEKSAIGSNARLLSRLLHAGKAPASLLPFRGGSTKDTAVNLSRFLGTTPVPGTPQARAFDDARFVVEGLKTKAPVRPLPASPSQRRLYWREGLWSNDDSLARYLSGRHGDNRRAFTASELIARHQQQGAPGPLFRGFKGRGTPFVNATAQPGTALFTSGHPEVAFNYGLPDLQNGIASTRQGPYVSVLDPAALAQAGPMGPLGPHYGMDTRTGLNRSLAHLLNRVGTFVSPLVSLLRGNRLAGSRYFEQVATTPADMRPATLASYKYLGQLGPGGEKLLMRVAGSRPSIPGAGS